MGLSCVPAPIGLQKWAIAIYMMATGIKGTSSMKIYRELGMRQAPTWFMMHRIREAFDASDGLPLQGSVEAEETYISGKRRKKSNAGRRELRDAGRGAVGKEAVVDVKDRDINKTRAKVVSVTDTANVAGFVAPQTDVGPKVYNPLKPL